MLGPLADETFKQKVILLAFFETFPSHETFQDMQKSLKFSK